MIRNEDEARAYVAARGDTRAVARLQVLVEELAEENERQNLIAGATLAHVWQRHVADSAQLLDLARPRWSTWLDLGTGAGFPGLVIAALRPDRQVILVETRRKRIDWLERMSARLALENCQVEGVRAEQAGSFSAGVISARAFAPLSKLLAIGRRFSTTDTLWLLPKGRSAAQEVADLALSLRKKFHVEQSQTDPEAGIIVGRGIEPEGAPR